MNKKLIAFIVLTFSISWPIWYFSGILTRDGPFVYDAKWLIAQIGVFAPTLSALIISSFSSKKLQWNGIRFFILIVLIFIAGIVITSTRPGVIGDFSQTLSLVVIIVGLAALVFFSSLNKRLLIPASGQTQGNAGAKMILLALLGFPFVFVIVWLLVNLQGYSLSVSTLNNGTFSFLASITTIFCMNLILGGSIGEETGWRGFALPILLKQFSPVKASLVLGLIIACWHLPVDASDFSIQAVGMIVFRFAWSLALSIIFTWFFLKTGSSLLVVIIFHTAINILPDIGFSRYEQSLLILTVPLIILSILASLKLQSMPEYKNYGDEDKD